MEESSSKSTSPSPSPKAIRAESNVATFLHERKVSNLFDAIVETIRAYVVLDDNQVICVTLWIAMSHVIDAVDVAPLMLITAPEKACGKTQLLALISYLVANPLPAANCSLSFIFRSIELNCPTLLIDEADTFLKENAELKGVLNAGYTRSNAYVGRTEADGKGGFVPKLFNVWCAKAIAGIAMERHLPAATLSRCLKVALRRKMPHEEVSRLRHADRTRFQDLATCLVQFGAAFGERIKAARPKLPEQLSDRAQDNWDALFAIAECAGPVWRERAVKAALALYKDEQAAGETGNELLEDIRNVFYTKRVTKISTEDLIKWLSDDSEAPWATYNRGRPITPRQLAKLLSAYGPHIKPKTVRMGTYNTPKGYELSQFTDVFSRYLTQKDPAQTTEQQDHQDNSEPPELLAAIREIMPKYGRTADAAHAKQAGMTVSRTIRTSHHTDADF